MTLADPSKPIIIRTHDRILFKKCRVLWDFQSPNRHNYTTVRPSVPLVMGTSLHAGLEYSYNPKLTGDPRELVESEAIALFVETLRGLIGTHYPPDTLDELIVLGRAMLMHYFEYYVERDLEWDIRFTEVPFSIPIPLRHSGARVYDNVTYVADDIYGHNSLVLAEMVELPGLGKVPKPVLYEGQLDIVAVNLATGIASIWDHKSTDRLDLDGFSWLDLDDQVNAYYWVAHNVLNLDVDSVLFNYLRKAMPPSMPKLIRNGKTLSKDHSQKTSRQLYLDAIKIYGFDPNDYMDFVNAYQEPTYFHRETVYKRERDLIAIEQNIVAEAETMITASDKIYPSPSMLNCRNCAFQHPCRIRQGGGDPIQWIESSGLFKKNTSYGQPVDG